MQVRQLLASLQCEFSGPGLGPEQAGCGAGVAELCAANALLRPPHRIAGAWTPSRQAAACLQCWRC